MSDKDPKDEGFAGSISNFYGALAKHPMELMRMGMNTSNELFSVFSGLSTAKSETTDKRFADPVWDSNPAYRALKESYIAWCRNAMKGIDDLDLDHRDTERLRLLTNTFLDTWSPTNVLMGNPAAMKKTLETGGENVVAGFRNFIDDVVNNNGMPSSVDRSKFTVGENLGITKGDVIHRDSLRELIQYAPQTKKIKATPILIVPPQINKFYVWDLSPERSLVEFLVREGFTVFIVSWRNPGPEDADYGLDDYVRSLDEASEIVAKVTGSDKIHVAGACSGAVVRASASPRYIDRSIAFFLPGFDIVIRRVEPSFSVATPCVAVFSFVIFISFAGLFSGCLLGSVITSQAFADDLISLGHDAVQQLLAGRHVIDQANNHAAGPSTAIHIPALHDTRVDTGHFVDDVFELNCLTLFFFLGQNALDRRVGHDPFRVAQRAHDKARVQFGRRDDGVLYVLMHRRFLGGNETRTQIDTRRPHSQRSHQ